MKKRMVLGVLPAVGISAIPALACPACMPALASVLGAIGLTFLSNRTYLLWVNLMALALALTILFAKRHANGYAPLLLGTAGAAMITLGKFVLARNVLAWLGVMVLAIASALTMFGRAGTKCRTCANDDAVVRGGKEYGKEES